ncbi:hypothetical protein [Pedobacter sp. MR2016-24]|uniref:hypothetical protein n=1 Tax=Pedobacter sp. MR2016-24 TaxID=2994466 RepID=UPI002247A39B|nr:hypothetical protein [Pedobacter sp. MR2016-24]MCX2485024.1 hypothetical protein [Pedobacter sp. MR2016-24]
MFLENFEREILASQTKPLSGGIVASNLKINDNRTGLLTLTGDILITLKVLDLTTLGAFRIQSLMKSSEQTIMNKLRGGADSDQIIFYEYSSVKNTFTNKQRTYSLKYNFNYTAKLIQINSLSQLAGNDFVLALVDGIGHRFTDMYGRKYVSGGLAKKNGGPAAVIYKEWEKNYLIGVHEFFHTLGLPDLEESGMENRLMYHLGRVGSNITNNEKAAMNKFIMYDLRDMTKGSYSNPGYNTANQLRTFLNDKSNGFIYNKAKFR